MNGSKWLGEKGDGLRVFEVPVPFFALALALCLALGVGPAAIAHPVPRQNHDRTIMVRLTGTGVEVDYRLELDEFTAVVKDLPEVLEPAELTLLKTPAEFHEAFARGYAPILGDNLIATLDGQALTFHCTQHLVRLHDDNGQKLDHLRLDFHFRCPWPAGLSGPHILQFQEGNYILQEGKIALALARESPISFVTTTEPPKSLQEMPSAKLQPGDDAQLRKASTVFVLPQTTSPDRVADPQSLPTAESSGHSSLLTLLLDPQRGFWMLLLLAAGFGAAHAMTPGHGKTLVAAYLVGERGTMWHALVLGLVTTLTHTGAVLILAAVLFFLYPDTLPAQVQEVLGVGGGLLVAGLGVWLLLRRLALGSDHVHVGGGHHHHLPVSVNREGGWWGLIVLGISGGIVPCWDAIAMFGFGVSAHRMGLALQLLLAFSAGLAAVLILIGVLVVRVKGFAGSRWGGSLVFQLLPLVSAILVTGLGLWLCYDSLHAMRGAG
jgi:ABC-type nickel/cobalt efflux system permease component RcnA